MAKTLQVKADIIADTASYVAGVKRATAATDKFGRATKKAGSSNAFRNIGRSAVAATAGVVSLYGAYSEGKKAIDATTKLAKGTLQLQRVTNMSAKDASRFAAVLQERGIEATKASVSFTALSKQIVAAQSGTAKAADAFKKLGVSQELIKKGDTQAVLLKAADGLSKMDAGAQRTALAAQLFGKSYKDLLPLLLMGSKGISKQTALAGRLGAEFSGKGLQSAKQFIGGQREMNTTILGLQVALGTALMPALTKGMKAVTKFVLQFRDGKGAGGEFKRTLIDIKDVLVPVAGFLKHHAKLVFGMITAWYAFKKVAMAINVFQTVMGGFGGVGKWAAAGTARGTAFGGAFKAGAAVGLLAIIALELQAGALRQESISKKQDLTPGTKKWNAMKNDPRYKQWISSDAQWQTDEMGRAFGRHGHKIAESMTTVIKKARKAGITSAGSFGAIGETGSNRVSDGIRGGAGGVKGAIASTVAAARRKGLVAAGSFGPIGSNMAHGIAAGINAGIQSVVDAAVRAVNNARDAAKRASKQNSPSKVFAEIGAGLVEGMALGMRDTSSLVHAAGKMVKAATPKIPGMNAGVRAGMVSGINSAGGFGSTQGVRSSFGQDAVNQMLLEALTYAAAHVKKEKVPKGASTKERNAINGRNTAAQTRADNALNALSARMAALAARATAVDTLRSYIQSIIDAVKSAKLAEIMAPINTARETRANNADIAGRASLGARISQAQLDADDPKVQARYQREAARLQARITQAQKAGNLDLVDSLQGEKDALDARYGPAYITGLQDELAQLNENAVERTADTTAQKFADAFGVGINAAFQAFLDGGSIATFIGLITTGLAGAWTNGTPTGVSLPSIPNAGIPEALGTIAGTDSSGNPTASGGGAAMTLKDWVNAWLGQHPAFTKTKPAKASVIGAAFGVSKAAVWAAGGTGHFGGKVANKASGGYLSPGALTMVGETGPELVVGGKVNSATRTSRMGAGGMNITINAVGNAANDPVALARELGWQLATR